MNNKGFTIVELIMAIFSLAIMSGGIYLLYLVIRALQKYIVG